MGRDGATSMWMLPVFGVLAVCGVLLLNLGFRPAGFLLIGGALGVLGCFAMSRLAKNESI